MYFFKYFRSLNLCCKDLLYENIFFLVLGWTLLFGYEYAVLVGWKHSSISSSLPQAALSRMLPSNMGEWEESFARTHTGKKKNANTLLWKWHMSQFLTAHWPELINVFCLTTEVRKQINQTFSLKGLLLFI